MAIDIIKGEQYAITGGNPNGGFLDVGAVVSDAIDKTMADREKYIRANSKASVNRENKAKQAEKKLAGYLNQMQTGLNIQGLNDSQNKAIKDFLMEKKAKYVEAANMLSGMSITDDGYQDLVDQMNQANQDIINAANNLKAYKNNQVELFEDFNDNLLSAGDPIKLNQAASIYNPSATFSFKPNGGLMFETDYGQVDYSMFKNPAPKANKTATALLEITEKVYNGSFKSGQEVNQYQLSSLRSQIQDAIGGNQDVARSIVMDKLLTNTPLDISDEDFSDPSRLSSVLVDRLLEGIVSASKKGVSDNNSQNYNSNKNKPLKILGSGRKEVMIDGKYVTEVVGNDGMPYYQTKNGNVYTRAGIEKYIKGDNNVKPVIAGPTIPGEK
jgi:uncharacterized protein YutE (UPF0331/DUF86 family)